MSDTQDGAPDGNTNEVTLRLAVRFESLELTNFLSYKSAKVDFSDLVALVGPNASGKSNLVAAMKLLREIPVHGLPVALARRGGFDQLRHRSAGRPYDPSIRINFRMSPDLPPSFYELKLGAVNPRSYRVKSEIAEVYLGSGLYRMDSNGKRVNWSEYEVGAGDEGTQPTPRDFPVPPGQSALANSGFAGYIIYQVLQQIQTVEINPAVVAELQLPSSLKEFEPDGSNATSVYELLDARTRSELLDELNAIVPGIVRVSVQRLADRQTFRFAQQQRSGDREFYAKQMSDGTLRAFSILLAMKQPMRPSLIVIEEPEVAIHLGALRTLMDILLQESEGAQVVITTHSADIVDSVDVNALRVVWSDDGESHVGRVAPHTVRTVRAGLISQGALLRADSLDAEEGE